MMDGSWQKEFGPLEVSAMNRKDWDDLDKSPVAAWLLMMVPCCWTNSYRRQLCSGLWIDWSLDGSFLQKIIEWTMSTSLRNSDEGLIRFNLPVTSCKVLLTCTTLFSHHSSLLLFTLRSLESHV